MLSIRCVIEGPPVPWERITRDAQGHGYMPAKSRNYQRHVASVVGLHIGPNWPTDGRYLVGMRFVVADNRTRDLDNLEKQILDALKKARVYADDGQVDGTEKRRAVDRARPRVELLIVVNEPIADTPLLRGLLSCPSPRS